MTYLFKDWDKLKSELSGRFLILFLDFDGTLAPLADTPGEADASRETKNLLKRLSVSPNCRIAVISGRSLDDVKNKLEVRGIIYSGNHGLEIEGPQLRYVPPVPSGYQGFLEQLKESLREKIVRFKGALIEDKGLSFALHYRLVDKTKVSALKTIFHELVIEHVVKDKIRVKTGKEVLEVRPASEWNKGKVVLWLLARQKFVQDKKKVLPVYIGDDLTDEDAFKALKGVGVTIVVGNARVSHARYYVKNTGEVEEFLRRIARLQGGDA